MKTFEPDGRVTSREGPADWGKWGLIALLWFAFFLNQGDRQIYNVVLDLIGRDLKLDPVQIGLVATIFTVYLLSARRAGLRGVEILLPP